MNCSYASIFLAFQHIWVEWLLRKWTTASRGGKEHGTMVSVERWAVQPPSSELFGPAASPSAALAATGRHPSLDGSGPMRMRTES